MSESSTPRRSLTKEQIIATVKTLQFAWFIGHVLVLTGSSIYFLFYFSKKVRFTSFCYHGAFYGVVESFGIIIYQLVKSKSLGSAKQFLADDNVQYFLVALFWLYLAPIVSLALLPFMLFSFFHVLTYTRAYLLPILKKENSALSSQINNFVRSYNDSSIYLAAYLELVTFSYLFLRLLTFRRQSLIPFIVYLFFIKFRYEKSIFTRNIIKDFEIRMDTLVAQESIPAGVRGVWASFKQYVRKYSIVLVHDHNTKSSKTK